jgi:hypothetical protein
MILLFYLLKKYGFIGIYIKIIFFLILKVASFIYFGSLGVTLIPFGH